MANLKHSILLSILLISVCILPGCEKNDKKEAELASQIKQLEAYIKEQDATINEFQQYVDSLADTESTEPQQTDEEPIEDSSEELMEEDSEESETDENNV